jgi:23S rRNA (cytosine1962-C5)-methyltransferase
VLDCFSNQGALALFCKAAGAREVTAVESSEDCIRLAGDNAKRNRLEVEWKEDNAFDFLKAAEKGGAEYDLVVLDPPSFTRNRGKLNEAMRGYKEIHLRSMKLMKPGGILATFCCSHHVSSEEFLACIADAAVDAHCSLRLLKRLGQAQDHPVLLHIPETEYLKGYIFELVPGR